MDKTLIGLALAASLTLPGLGHAQTNCAMRDKVVMRLADTYGEQFSGGGLRDAKSVFEVWISEIDGTWTILMTRADGVSCVMASGTNWRKGLGEVPLMGVPG